jgi:putative Mg2+ transporter-C (MgtC) family protein
MQIAWWELLLRLVGAAAVGALVGIEREIAGKRAGLRTHLLVGLGSGLLVCLAFAYPEPFEPMRVVAGVITGIGFLGAGAIFREGANVQGLTTAATIWMTSALGMAVGLGLYWAALVALVIVLLVLRLLMRAEIRMPKLLNYAVSITLYPSTSHSVEEVLAFFRQQAIKVQEVESSGTAPDDSWKFRLIVPYRVDLDRIMVALPSFAARFAISSEKNS